MKVCSCDGVFISCLEMFIQALNSPYQRLTLQQGKPTSHLTGRDPCATSHCLLSLYIGVRQFFHRMVVCLEADILSFVPTMVKLMLETPDVKELYDFIPMLNQLVTKFKVSISASSFCNCICRIFRWIDYCRKPWNHF